MKQFDMQLNYDRPLEELIKDVLAQSYDDPEEQDDITTEALKHIFGKNISRIVASANELTVASRQVAEGTMPHAYYQEIYGLAIASIIGHIVVCHWAFNKECDHGIPLYKCSLCQPNSVTTQTYDLRNPEEKDKWDESD